MNHDLFSRFVKRTAVIAGLLAGFCSPMIAAPASGDACANLKSTFQMKNTTITSAETVLAGISNLQDPPVSGLETPRPPVSGIPSFCRVIGVLKPTSDSQIGIEVWLPVSGWNGRFEAIANHELGGEYYYGDMATELKKNFAVASTDTGHEGTKDISWAVGHPDRITDYAWRAVHEMTVTAKAVISMYYGSQPRYSYYNGCSTGGRQTQKESQMFPDDYNGILSGSGFHYWTNVGIAGLWKIQTMLKDGLNGPAYLPPSKYKLVVDAAMSYCSHLKAVPTDAFLSNAESCDWKPQTLVCGAGQDTNTCITGAQADALEKIYEPLRNPRTGEEIYPGATRITQPNWAANAARQLANPSADPPRSLESIMFNKPDWSWRTVNFDSDVTLANQVDADGPQINAINPDLSKFWQHGGKLIEYQGWLDSNLAPYAVEHYDNVVKKVQQDKGGDALEQTQSFYRLFLVPAMGHCRGGPGPNTFGAETHPAVPNDPQHDIFSALQEWVEHGTAPKQVIATKYVKDDPKQGIAMQRPLCPYPQEARYNGSGNTADAKNFSCVNAKP